MGGRTGVRTGGCGKVRGPRWLAYSRPRRTGVLLALVAPRPLGRRELIAGNWVVPRNIQTDATVGVRDG